MPDSFLAVIIHLSTTPALGRWWGHGKVLAASHCPSWQRWWSDGLMMLCMIQIVMTWPMLTGFLGSGQSSSDNQTCKFSLLLGAGPGTGLCYQVPATKLGNGSFSNLKNPHQNCTRASISIAKKQKVKLELELEVPFKIIELASKDRNQKVLFKSKNRTKTGKLDHSFLWSLFWFAHNWCNTYLQSVVWSFLLNLICDTTFLIWECS